MTSPMRRGRRASPPGRPACRWIEGLVLMTVMQAAGDSEVVVESRLVHLLRGDAPAPKLVEEVNTRHSGQFRRLSRRETTEIKELAAIASRASRSNSLLERCSASGNDSG